MHSRLLALAIILVGLTGCGQVSAGDQPTVTIGTVLDATTTTVSGAPVTTALAVTPAPGRATTTTVGSPAATVRPATTTTTRPPTRSEATARLCVAVEEADRRIQGGSYVGGGLRLSGGLAANEKAADPGVAMAARSMLTAGLHGDAEGYATAREAASNACARAGYPIHLSSPIMCVQAPCP